MTISLHFTPIQLKDKRWNASFELGEDGSFSFEINDPPVGYGFIPRPGPSYQGTAQRGSSGIALSWSGDSGRGHKVVHDPLLDLQEPDSIEWWQRVGLLIIYEILRPTPERPTLRVRLADGPFNGQAREVSKQDKQIYAMHPFQGRILGSYLVENGIREEDPPWETVLVWDASVTRIIY